MINIWHERSDCISPLKNNLLDMKTVIFLLFLFAASVSRCCAQQDTTALPVKSGNEWQMPRDVLLRARSFSGHIQQLLGLDSITTKKLFDLYLGNTKAVDEIRIGKTSDKEKKAALAAYQREFDQKIKTVLTPAQFEKYMRESPGVH
jgi:hypothetical protein